MNNRQVVFPFIIALFLLIAGCSQNDVAVKKGAAELNELDERGLRVSSFVLGPGDTIEVSVYRHDDLKKTVKIEPTGKFMYPLIGEVTASGRDTVTLREELRERLSRYIVDPNVVVNVSSVQSQKVLVVGEVNNPGVFPLDSSLSIAEAIGKAGGATHDAKLANVILISSTRNGGEAVSLDISKAFKNGDITGNKTLKSGDIVYVPAVKIADVSWFFSHLGKILNPIVSLETGIVLWPQVLDAINGEATPAPLTIQR